jgi:hypothetical protein
MTVYSLGPHDKKQGPFAEVHAQNQSEARRKAQAADVRRNWMDEELTYCIPIGPNATRYISQGEVRIYEKFEDLPPA